MSAEPKRQAITITPGNTNSLIRAAGAGIRDRVVTARHQQQPDEGPCQAADEAARLARGAAQVAPHDPGDGTERDHAGSAPHCACAGAREVDVLEAGLPQQGAGDPGHRPRQFQRLLAMGVERRSGSRWAYAPPVSASARASSADDERWDAGALDFEQLMSRTAASAPPASRGRPPCRPTVARRRRRSPPRRGSGSRRAPRCPGHDAAHRGNARARRGARGRALPSVRRGSAGWARAAWRARCRRGGATLRRVRRARRSAKVPRPMRCERHGNGVARLAPIEAGRAPRRTRGSRER